MSETAAMTEMAAKVPPNRLPKSRPTVVRDMPVGEEWHILFTDVVLPKGRTHRLYVLWMGQHQYMPEVGNTCTIGYRREALLPGNLHRPEREGAPDPSRFNVVQELGCGFASNPAPPPAVQRSPSAW